jgi:hypothetical protein
VNQSAIQVLLSGTAISGTVTQPSNTTLVFTPTSALVANSTYTIKVNGFADSNGNTVATAISTFTTGTVTASGGLTLTSTSIVNGATVTPTTSPAGPPITLTFSQILDPATVNTGTLLVMDGFNSNYGLAGTYVVTGNSVTFTPSSPYPPGATIYVGATGGLTDVAATPTAATPATAGSNCFTSPPQPLHRTRRL